MDMGHMHGNDSMAAKAHCPMIMVVSLLVNRNHAYVSTNKYCIYSFAKLCLYTYIILC